MVIVPILQPDGTTTTSKPVSECYVCSGDTCSLEEYIYPIEC